MKNYLANMPNLYDNPIINPPWSENSRPISWIEKIIIHHDAQERPHDYDNLSRYEAEAKYQNETSIPGSKGLQYSCRIDNEGTITWCRPLTTFLWHCGDYTVNQHSIAVCLDGNFQAGQQTPTREQYEALKQLLDNLSTQHPEFPAAQGDVYPHRHFFPTNCCGDNLVPFVEAYRNNKGAVDIPAVPYDHPELQPTVPAPEPPPIPADTPSISIPQPDNQTEVAPSPPPPTISTVTGAASSANTSPVQGKPQDDFLTTQNTSAGASLDTIKPPVAAPRVVKLNKPVNEVTLVPAIVTDYQGNQVELVPKSTQISIAAFYQQDGDTFYVTQNMLDQNLPRGINAKYFGSTAVMLGTFSRLWRIIIGFLHFLTK